MACVLEAIFCSLPPEINPYADNSWKAGSHTVFWRSPCRKWNKSMILLWKINFIFKQTFLLFCTSNMTVVKTLFPVLCHSGRELVYFGAKGWCWWEEGRDEGGGGGKGDSDGQFTISSNCGESGTYNHVASLWISDLFYMKLFSACEHVTVLKNILATIRSFHIMTSWSSSNKTEWSGCYTHIRLQCMCLSSSVETKKYFHESGVKFSTLYVRRKLIIPQLYYTWPFCQIYLFLW